jgi:hypothetical protein
VDSAGNRSREIRSWTVTIDQMVVYAAPSGNDYADGSRSAPVRSIGRALQIASTTERKTIFAAAGLYIEDSPLKVNSDVALAGGLDPDTWQPLGLERWSTLRTSAAWRSAVSLFTVAGGKVSVKGFELSSGPIQVPALLSVTGGVLSVQQSSVSFQGPAAGQGIAVSGGAVTLLDCRMQAAGPWRGSFVTVTGGSFGASGSRFSGPTDTTDFAAIELTDSRAVTLKGVTIDPGAGARTRGIRAVRSELSISGSSIGSGSGALESIGIDTRDGVLSVENADVAAATGARSPTAILASGSRVSVTRSRISIGGTTSAVGISTRGGSLVLLRTTMRAAAAREYLSLLRMEDSRSLVADNLLVGAAAGQSVGIQVKGGSADILNNTLAAGTGTTITVGILVQGDQLPRMVNNIITRPGSELGTAIAVIEARTAPAAAVILSNTFGGWQRLLRVDSVQGLGRPAVDVATLSALNAADGDAFGGPVSGNRSETAAASFRQGQADAYKLDRGSLCLDGGTDITAPGGPGGTGPVLLVPASEVAADILGNPRPAPVQLTVPGPPRGWDIGAYEFSE